MPPTYRDYHTGEVIDGPRVQFGNRHGELVIRIQNGDRYKTISKGTKEMNFADINSFVEWFIQAERAAPWVDIEGS